MTTRIRTAWTWFSRIALGLVLGLVILGCNKSKEASEENEPATGSPQGPPVPGVPPSDVLAKLPGGDEFAAAKRVYANNNCANCHKLGETGGRGMKGGPPGGKGGPPGGRGGRGGPGGPDLTHAGAKAEHTTEWLAAHIRDPKSHKPQSRMPAYGQDKISDADLTLLAEYLTSRK